VPSFSLVENQTAREDDAKTPREDSQGGQGGKGEKILTTEITEGTKGKRCKLPAQRSRRKEGCGLWIIRP
jgi:hypothetical protein